MEVFGDIKKRKEQLRRKLGGVQSKLGEGVTPGLFKLKSRLKRLVGSCAFVRGNTLASEVYGTISPKW